jgi:hypothetical protein
MPEVADWDRLSLALRELHLALMERARRDYERENGVVSAAEFLQLLLTDPSFAWLRPLSELMADIDLAREADPEVREEIATAVRPVVEHLLGSSADESGTFAGRYWQRVEDEPHVTMAHGGVKRALAGWPQRASPDADSALHERHRLAEKVRHRKRR